MGMIKLTPASSEQAAGNSPFNEGWYTLLFEDYQEKLDKKKARLDVYVSKVVAVDSPDNASAINKKAFHNVSEGYEGFAIPMWRAAGANIPEKISEQGISLDPKFMIGRKVKAHNSPKLDKQNVLRNNWDQFVPAE